MRIRYKKWARPELEACTFFIDNPESLRGKWHKAFKKEQPIYMELRLWKRFFYSKPCGFKS